MDTKNKYIIIRTLNTIITEDKYCKTCMTEPTKLPVVINALGIERIELDFTDINSFISNNKHQAITKARRLNKLFPAYTYIALKIERV